MIDLPSELIREIHSFLPPRDSAIFGLANKDFLKLHRSRKYLSSALVRELCINPSDAYVELFQYYDIAATIKRDDKGFNFVNTHNLMSAAILASSVRLIHYYAHDLGVNATPFMFTVILHKKYECIPHMNLKELDEFITYVGIWAEGRSAADVDRLLTALIDTGATISKHTAKLTTTIYPTLSAKIAGRISIR